MSLTLVDCTLREGEQTAGVWFTVEEKLALASALADAGLTLLDAGMPAVSEEERRFLSLVTGRTTARIGASVRALPEEVRLACDVGCDELFLICPTSERHVRSRLGLDASGLLSRVEAVVGAARAGGRTANVVCEDASRTTPEALDRVYEVALQAGAERVFLCDTVGIWTPLGAARAVAHALERVPAHRLGVHCHNDLGMATANTLAAVEAGAGVPTATVNGVGERAGNASLVEVAAAVERLLRFPTGFRLGAAAALSATVERLTGFIVAQHQPLVGWNAFRHESGIHVDGVLKDPETYEALAPETLGRGHGFATGKHSGRAGLRAFAQAQGLPSDDETLRRVLARVKASAPSGAREGFARVREALDDYNRVHLGVPEAQLREWFESPPKA